MHMMCTMEELMPSIGTSVPSPSILSVVICQTDSTLQNVGKLYCDVPHIPTPDADFDNPFDFCDESLLVSKTHLISISDDGKIWNWLLTAEGAGDTQKDSLRMVADVSEVPVSETSTNTVPPSTDGPAVESTKQSEHVISSKNRRSTSNQEDMYIKVGE